MRDSLSAKNTKVGPDVCWSRIKQSFFDSFLPRSILPSSSSSPPPLHRSKVISAEKHGVKKEKFDKAEFKTEKRSVFRKRKKERDRGKEAKKKKKRKSSKKKKKKKKNFLSQRNEKGSHRGERRLSIRSLDPRTSPCPLVFLLQLQPSFLLPLFPHHHSPPPSIRLPSSFSSSLPLLPPFSFLFFSFLFSSLACFAKSPHGRKRHVQLWNKNVATSNAITRELREQLQNADAVLEVRRRTRGRGRGEEKGGGWKGWTRRTRDARTILEREEFHSGLNLYIYIYGPGTGRIISLTFYHGKSFPNSSPSHFLVNRLIG